MCIYIYICIDILHYIVLDYVFRVYYLSHDLSYSYDKQVGRHVGLP